ncbi:uncharacterized protein TNCT_713621 [Trichonephila clavata]|uniref:Uncharacterized protein n=1 Tax=Trichonephila clavata TaxID=2740835 RepID=A0A8X6J3V0_TRICU|nr:uncharacterized protein TNCT_713621 [Trichonephila clavata]
MRLSLAIIIVLCIVNLEARERRNKERNRESGDGRKRNSPKYGGGSRKKQPFHMFESCRDFNVEYVQKMKELKRNKEIGRRNCQERDYAMCMQKDMESIRCSVTQEPSEECKMEINNFLNGVSCDNNEEGSDDRRETEEEAGNGGGNEEVVESIDDEEDEIEDPNGSKGEDGGLDEGEEPGKDYEPAL